MKHYTVIFLITSLLSAATLVPMEFNKLNSGETLGQKIKTACTTSGITLTRKDMNSHDFKGKDFAEFFKRNIVTEVSNPEHVIDIYAFLSYLNMFNASNQYRLIKQDMVANERQSDSDYPLISVIAKEANARWRLTEMYLLQTFTHPTPGYVVSAEKENINKAWICYDYTGVMIRRKDKGYHKDPPRNVSTLYPACKLPDGYNLKKIFFAASILSLLVMYACYTYIRR